MAEPNLNQSLDGSYRGGGHMDAIRLLTDDHKREQLMAAAR